MALPIGMGLLTLQFIKTILQDALKLKEDAFAEGQVPR
jgi:TRAP-type C4-dicarboxylate transport system permease small subunit